MDGVHKDCETDTWAVVSWRAKFSPLSVKGTPNAYVGKFVRSGYTGSYFVMGVLPAPHDSGGYHVSFHCHGILQFSWLHREDLLFSLERHSYEIVSRGPLSTGPSNLNPFAKVPVFCRKFPAESLDTTETTKSKASSTPWASRHVVVESAVQSVTSHPEPPTLIAGDFYKKKKAQHTSLTCKQWI